jgi:predicted transposase/invertase (TIGR01784 family)
VDLVSPPRQRHNAAAMTTTGKYLHPFTDWGFKRLFGSELGKELLIDFLNSLLPSQHQIQELTFARNEQVGRNEYDRRAIFDLFCVSPSGERFIVEMQKAKQTYFKDRSVFYATFPISEQAPKGDWDFKLEPVYLVGILDFVFAEDKNDNEVIHTVQLKDQINRVFYDKLMFIYLEMPKFTKTEAELQTLTDKWLYVLKHLPELTDRPAKLQERVFSRLFELAEVGKFNRTERALYEESLKVYRDLTNVVDTAKTEGKAEGIEEGIEIGERKKAQNVARYLLQANMPLDFIVGATGLSETEIEALRD